MDLASKRPTGARMSTSGMMPPTVVFQEIDAEITRRTGCRPGVRPGAAVDPRPAREIAGNRRSDEPLGVGIRIRRTDGGHHDSHADLAPKAADVRTPFRSSRSQIRTWPVPSNSWSARVSWRPIWCMTRASGGGADPRIWTCWEAKSMRKTMSYATRLRHVHTSVVKKSAPRIPPQWALRNGLPGRRSLRSRPRPSAFRMRRIGERHPQ